MVFSCLVPDVWNLIFNLVTILVLLPPAPCPFICTPHNSPFWDLCTLASDLPRTAVAHTTKLGSTKRSHVWVPCLIKHGNVR